ncbi:unnamed protein product, partial [Effrenium voratum]
SCSSTDGYAGHGVDHADCGPPGKRLDQAAEGFLLMCKIFDNFNIMITQLWGSSMAEAFAQVCVGMFNYMTPLDKEQSLSATFVRSVDVEATGHDMLDLLYTVSLAG